MAKYGMSMCVLGMAEELKGDGIAVNALWPRTGTLLPVHHVDWGSVVHVMTIRLYIKLGPPFGGASVVCMGRKCERDISDPRV